MNIYDFDKTLYKKDSSISFLFFCISKKPILFFHLFKIAFFALLNIVGIISTTKFKEKYFSFVKRININDQLLSEFWTKEHKNFKSWFIKNLDKEQSGVVCSASPEFLVKAGIDSLGLKNFVVIATKMDKVTGKIDGKNCKGYAKIERLTTQLGNIEFENGYSDSVSDLPMLDLAKNKFIVCGKNLYEFGKQKPTFSQKLYYIIKQLRPKHYIKNLLIALPLFFSFGLSAPRLIGKVCLGILSFCCVCSFIYVVNDLCDANADRKHKTKRMRPIASYMIKPVEAIILAIILLVISIGINCFASTRWISFATLALYALLNLAYSFKLKHCPIIDVFALAGCYLLRVFYGGVIIDVSISSWLYLTVMCAALYMGFGKRRNEVTKQGTETRKVNSLYTKEFLDKNMYVCFGMTLVFYSLWAISAPIALASGLNHILILASIPMVYMILMKYCFNLNKAENNGDPIDVLLKDKLLIALVVLYLILMVVVLYVPIR